MIAVGAPAGFQFALHPALAAACDPPGIPATDVASPGRAAGDAELAAAWQAAELTPGGGRVITLASVTALAAFRDWLDSWRQAAGPSPATRQAALRSAVALLARVAVLAEQNGLPLSGGR